MSAAAPRKRMQRSIATVCLSGALQEKLEAAAAIGFDGVEIFEADLLAYDGTAADIRNIADSLGLNIDIFQPFRDFESMPEPQRRRNMDRAERKFDVMQELGTDLVLVCSNTQPSSVDDDARAAADLREMAERAHRRGLRIGFEALAWSRHINTWRHAWKVVQEADHPALGLIVDSFHTLSLGDDPSGLAHIPGDRIFYVQLADAPKLSMDVLSWSRHYRNFPGQGGLDVAGFTKAVLASGYQGPLSLEIFNDDFRAAPSQLTARDGLRSLVYIEAQAGGPQALPEPPRFDGIEFIEFAVDEQTGAELAAFLASLGFNVAGRHRSKDVTLYRQGRVNLLLNAEQDSAASEYFHLHGPSVCAFGLRVDDAGRALARARALLCPDWEERHGPGERNLPGVRAPDGTLIYLVAPDPSGRTIWDSDFEPEGGEQEPGNLTGIDHIAQALPQGRMDSFVLFHRAVFGLEPQGLFELPDPFGLIRSRAMVSTDQTVRFPLNISDSRHTATGRFVSAYSGAGVHHLALDTPDLIGTLDRLAGLGAAILPIPPNYYDDLGARWGLEDAELNRLHRHNALYDRDDGGEFLHAYSVSFHDRFFFELCERRGGYAGFGAANAGVRMAAQAHVPRADVDEEA